MTLIVFHRQMKNIFHFLKMFLFILMKKIIKIKMFILKLYFLILLNLCNVVFDSLVKNLKPEQLEN